MLKSGKFIRVESKSGASMKIDTSLLNAGARLQPALDHLLAGGKLSELSEADRSTLAKKKSLIGSGDAALIVRFDLKVVRIDESSAVDLGKLVRKAGV